MFAEAAIVVGALLCAKAGAVTYAYVYHRETFDQQCANCERATRGFDFGNGEEEETLVVEKGGERLVEEPSAPKRMQDLKKGRSFKKMFSIKKKDKKKGGGSGGESGDGGFDAKEL